MAFCDSSKFNETMTKIKDLIDWYENKHFDKTSIRLFLASGESFKYYVTKDSIAHMLGIKTDYLSTCGMFNTTKSYELIKELINNEHRISSRILNNEIKLSDIFNKHIDKKIEIFKSNISINLENTLFVCKYDRNKAILCGEQPRNCDYIIVKEMEDGKIQELDIVKSGYIIKPVSSRMYENEQEAKEKFEQLLKYQDISILTSIIINSDYYVEGKKLHLKEKDRLFKLQQIENMRIKYNFEIDVVDDCEFYYKKVMNGKNIGRNNYDIISHIINCVLDGKIIDNAKLEISIGELTPQQKDLIDTLNDRIIMGVNNPENEESYSKLQNQVSTLKKARKILIEENENLKRNLEETTYKINELKVNNEKANQLIKTFKNALNNFDNSTE